ncbi:MAG: heparan-alpha-glucosaminide N-acetyltransferase [Coriobacteriales bacterium]
MRYHVLDNLRGLVFVSMAIFHTMWDLTALFGLSAPWFTGTPGYVWQQSILYAFVLLSGFCWGLGRRQLRRGLEVFGCGLVVTAVTALAMPAEAVYFGVLSFMGAAMMALVPFKQQLEKAPALPGLLLCAVIFLLARDIPRGALGFEGVDLCTLPDALYANWLTTALGFQMPGFASTDYVPFLPWIFLYLCGYFLWRLCPREEDGRLRLPCQRPWPVLAAVGRHCLPFYLVHQPLIYGALSLAALALGA